MAELVDALGLGSSEFIRGGSSPLIDTMNYKNHSAIYSSNKKLYEPVILDCPYAEQINPGLIEWIKKDITTMTFDGEALRTDFLSTRNELPCNELQSLFDWIDTKTVECADSIAQYTRTAYIDSPSEDKKFSIADYWGMCYNKGSHAVLHNHWPYAMSFAYYINCPEGSSPLVLEGNEIQVTEGRLVVFASHMDHKVDPCPVDNRFMIAGDISYAGVAQW